MSKNKRIKSGSSSNRERRESRDQEEEEEDGRIWRPFSRSLEQPSSDTRTSSPFVFSSYNEGPIDLSMHPPVTSSYSHPSFLEPQDIGAAEPSSSHYGDDRRNMMIPSTSSSTTLDSSHRSRRTRVCSRCRFHGGLDCPGPENCPRRDCDCSNCRGNPELDRLFSRKKMKDLLKLTKYSKDP